MLRKLKKAAENYLGETVTEAVITVPAYFNDSQRQATKDAGKIAGLDVKRIVNEPTAAALAYGLDKTQDHLIAVYDFGGGTFDISILEVGDKVVDVVSTNGDTHLGGDDVDQRIIEYLEAEFKKDTGIDVSGDKMVVQRLKDAAEKAKIELSTKLETTVNLAVPHRGRLGSEASQHPTHAREARVDDRRSRSAHSRALQEGACRCWQDRRGHRRGRAGRWLHPHPAVQEAVTKFFGKEPHKGVNPDEVVALGAAVQAGVLSGDVAGHGSSRRHAAQPGRRDPRWRHDRAHPAKHHHSRPERKRCFRRRRTARPRSRSTCFRASAPRRATTVPSAASTSRASCPRHVAFRRSRSPFDIDANGILSVTAKDEATGKDQKVTITANSGLSETEIDKMVEDAAAHEEEDKKRREQVEARNKADQLAYGVEKALEEVKDKLPADKVSEIEGKVKSLREAIEANDTAGHGNAQRGARGGDEGNRRARLQLGSGGARRRPRKRRQAPAAGEELGQR